MPHPPRSLLLVAVAAAVALVPAACGGDDGGSATPRTASPTSGAATDTGGTGPSATGGATVGVGATDLGDVLVDAEGFTLYVFDQDSPGSIACTGSCTEVWPPLTVADPTDIPTAPDGSTATFAVVERPEASFQVAAGDRPLYRYAADSAPGDANGQGVAGAWWAVGPDGAAIDG